MTEKVLVLNHHGLGELLMSLPSIRSLVKESSSMVYMTVSSEFDVQVCQNQRCGEKVFSFKWNESTFHRIKHKLYWNFDVITKYLGKNTMEVLHNDYLLDNADKGIRPHLVSNSFVVIIKNNISTI